MMEDKTLKLYTRVEITATKTPGTIVSVDTDGGTKPPIYLVEIDDEYKTGGPDDCTWRDPSELGY